MLSKKQPVLSDIVVFGSTCTVHLHTDKKSLGVRGKESIVIGKSDKMKGYHVYRPKERVVVAQHVQNIE